MTIAQLIAEFLAWLARHREPATAEHYRRRLQLFSAEFGPRDAVMAAPTALEVDAFLHAAGQGKSDTTRRHNAVALTSLQSFALRQRLIERPWFQKLEKPRAGKRERIPTPAELGALLQHGSIPFRRLVTGLCQSGARPGELCSLAIEQVHWAKNLCILEKHKTARRTGKPREIAIGKAFAGTLREAIAERTAGPVFLSPRGKGWTVDGFESTWRRLRQREQLPADLVPYLCRHRFGTELVRSGTPIESVKDLMGHANIATTLGYVHRSVAELASKQDLVPDLPSAIDESLRPADSCPPRTDGPPDEVLPAAA